MRSLVASILGARRAIAVAAALLAAPLADAAAQCPFSGLDAAGFGTGTGVCSSSTLQATLDTGKCSLSFAFAQDPFICGNTFLTQHLLILGVAAFPAGVPVSKKFLPDSRLYVDPLLVLGPLPGGTSTLPLPDDAALIGLTFFAQAAPTFITTVSLPIVPETGLSSALALTLQ